MKHHVEKKSRYMSKGEQATLLDPLSFSFPYCNFFHFLFFHLFSAFLHICVNAFSLLLTVPGLGKGPVNGEGPTLSLEMWGTGITLLFLWRTDPTDFIARCRFICSPEYIGKASL